MNAVAKQAIRKVAAVKNAAKVAEITKPKGLVSLFPGLARIDLNKSNSLFPGFVALVMDDARNQMQAARDARRSLRKDARALRRAERAARRASKGHATDDSLFNFGFLRVRANRKGTAFRVTFSFPSTDARDAFASLFPGFAALGA